MRSLREDHDSSCASGLVSWSDDYDGYESLDKGLSEAVYSPSVLVKLTTLNGQYVSLNTPWEDNTPAFVEWDVYLMGKYKIACFQGPYSSPPDPTVYSELINNLQRMAPSKALSLHATPSKQTQISIEWTGTGLESIESHPPPPVPNSHLQSLKYLSLNKIHDGH